MTGHTSALRSLDDILDRLDVVEASVGAGGGFTDEKAQDAIGAALTDSATVDFTYNDGAGTITAATIAAGVLAQILTVDGSGSGLDADLLDGQSSAAFAAASHSHAQSDVTSLTSDLAAKQPLDADLTTIAANITAAGHALLDDADAAAQRTTLGLGTLATQSGTFSGTSSGTNTGDQTNITGNAATVTSLTGATGIDAWRGVVYTTADLALTNAFADLTPASGPSLAFSVVASGVYHFHFYIIADADAATTGIDVACNGPASPTAINYEQIIWSAAGSPGGTNFGTAYDANPATANSPGTTKRFYEVFGLLVNGSNAGSVVARVKRENVGSATARAYSWVEWQRLS